MSAHLPRPWLQRSHWWLGCGCVSGRDSASSVKAFLAGCLPLRRSVLLRMQPRRTRAEEEETEAPSDPGASALACSSPMVQCGSFSLWGLRSCKEKKYPKVVVGIPWGQSLFVRAQEARRPLCWNPGGTGWASKDGGHQRSPHQGQDFPLNWPLQLSPGRPVWSTHTALLPLT